MIIGPRYKICRRLGNTVFEKCQTQRFMLSEQRHAKSARRPKQVSDFARQLLEKQRVRFGYGITDGQLRKYITAASQRTADTDPATHLFQLLETRLDNIVFRSGIASTRRQARQLVPHGHIRVNGRKVTIPSYTVHSTDTVEVRPESKSKSFFELSKERYEGLKSPLWIVFDPKTLTVKLTALPNPEPGETFGDLNAVLEFYSR